jgi:serine/threonine-protein kinase
MELLHRDSLYDRFRADGAMPWQRVAKIARAVCSSLAEAHALGIVHRDLKPANVMLVGAHGDRVKVLDFGLAKPVASRDSVGDVTKAGIILGTPFYLSPEALAGDRPDPRMDLYALGCVLFELLTGAPPYPQRNLAQQMLAHATEPIPVASAANPDVPASLDAALGHMLAKSPDERFGSMAAVRNALDAAMGSAAPPSNFAPATGSMIAASPVTEIHVAAQPKSHAALVLVLVALAIAAGVALALLAR